MPETSTVKDPSTLDKIYGVIDSVGGIINKIKTDIIAPNTTPKPPVAPISPVNPTGTGINQGNMPYILGGVALLIGAYIVSRK